METYGEAIAVLKTAKDIGGRIVTIIGGAQPTVCPDSILNEDTVDYVFRGEAEHSFGAFLDLLHERPVSSIKGLAYKSSDGVIKNAIDLPRNLDDIKIPDYGAIRLNDYIKNGYTYGGHYARSAPIWLTRGCPYQCGFCSCRIINGTTIRRHSIRYAVEWILHLYKEFSIRQFSIVDDNFTFDADYAKCFCKAMIRLRAEKFCGDRIFFTTPNGIRIDRIDDELLRLMKCAGWQGVTIAPESGSRNTLKRMKKEINPDVVPEVVKRIRANRLRVRAFFMVGYPGETPQDIKQTVALIRKCRFDAINIGRFHPLPGTPIFNELVSNGEISPDYLPPNNFTVWLPSQKMIRPHMYGPKTMERLNLFRIMCKEYILLILRNPYAIIYTLRYYGGFNIMSFFHFVWSTTRRRYCR